jgi:hypothetical protein
MNSKQDMIHSGCILKSPRVTQEYCRRRAGRITAPVVELLPSKCEALSPNCSNPTQKKNIIKRVRAKNFFKN